MPRREVEPLPGLGCQAEWQRGEVGLIGRGAVKARVWTPAIIKVQVAADRSASLGYAFVGPQIHLLVFDAAPQALDKHVVPPSSFTVHADRNAVAGQHTGEGRASELRTLVGIEDVRLAVTSQSILQRLDAERRLHGDRYAPRQHATAEPVEHNGQIDKAACHRDVGDVHRPHLVRSDNLHPTQQIWVDLVAGLRLRRPRTAIERLYPHPLHQRLYMTTADLAPLGSRRSARHPGTSKRLLQMQPVETPHDRKVGFRHRARQIVDAATADVQSFRLLGNGQVMRGLDHRFALSKPALPTAPSKKSFSSVSSPILACSDFTSTAGCPAPLPPPGPKTSAAPSSSCAFHDVI